MRIGIDATCLPSASAGAGRYIHGIVRGLADLDRDHEYFLFLKERDLAAFAGLSDNFNLVGLKNLPRPLRVAWQHLFAGWQGRRRHLDVWHGPHYSLPLGLNGTRRVVTFHDMGVFVHPEMYPAGKRSYFRTAIKRAAATAHRIITVSQATADELCELMAQRCIPAATAAAAPIISGVDARFFQPVSASELARTRRQLGLPDDYLLFVGTFEKRKNLVALLEAFRLVREQSGRQLAMVLAGQGANGEVEVQRKIKRLRLDQHVLALGYVAEQHLPALYQGASLFVLPSIYEGFGFPLLEAMAGGVVSLAYDNPASREVAGCDHMLLHGSPAQWATKIAALLANRTQQHEFIEYGRRRAAQFSWQRTASQLLEVYESIGRKRSGTSSTRLDTRLQPAKPTTNGVHRNGKTNGEPAAVPEVTLAVLRTLVYADLFDYPLTAQEIHTGLLDARASEPQVRQALTVLQRARLLTHQQENYYLTGRDGVLAERNRRQQYSQKLVARNRWALRLLQRFPFVRMIAISGALAFENCKANDDIDLFLIVEQRRLWLTYAALVVLLKLAGKRRTICLNCLTGSEALAVRDRDLFMAHQIAYLVPISGLDWHTAFRQANRWCTEYLPQARWQRTIAAVQNLLPVPSASWLTRTLERLLSFALVDRLEKSIFRRYSRRIARLTRGVDGRAIAVSSERIFLFTNDHRFRLLQQVQQRTNALWQKYSGVQYENHLSQELHS